jgi:hypothetical protein
MFYLTPAKHHLFLSSYSNLSSEMGAANKHDAFSLAASHISQLPIPTSQ